MSSDIQSLLQEKKNQTLLIVEGHDEKYELFKLLLNCFPELQYSFENLYIYNTNVYDFCHLIEGEYGEAWYELDDGIDIPLLISKHESLETRYDGRKFTNIILIFDYERQDWHYSDEKIMHLQEFFSRDNFNGVLYINYPMLEAYQHFLSIPDDTYQDKYVSVSDIKDGQYKGLVHKESYVRKFIAFYEKTFEAVQQNLENSSEEIIEKVVYELLSISSSETLREDIELILKDKCVDEANKKRLINNLYYAIIRFGYIKSGENFWEKLRKVFIYIAVQTIHKARKIQLNCAEVNEDLKAKFLNIDFEKVLEQQNIASSDSENEVVWIVSMCMLLLGDYKFFWSDK